MLKAQWTASSTRNTPPPEIYDPNDTHLAKITATFATSKATQACFGCDVDGQLVPDQPRWECRLHGAGAVSRGEPGPLFWRQQEPSFGRCLPVKGRARALSLPLPLHHIWIRGAASVGGWCDPKLAPSAPGGLPLGTADASSTPSASGATLTAPDGSGGVDSPPQPALRPAANERLPPRGLPPAGDPAPRPAQPGALEPSAGSPHPPRSCGRVGGGWGCI